jgi:hypothetical protein
MPDLSRNIKCGNSLIGNDFWMQGTLGLTEDEQYKVNAFDWEHEFAAIFKDGGFDAVVGNPPYVRIHEMSEAEKEHYRKNYISASSQFDLYQLFYEKGLNILTDGGVLGFITSNKFCITRYGKTLREYIFDNFDVLSIVDVSNINVFRDASTYPYIFVIKKAKTKNHNVRISLPEITGESILGIKISAEVSQAEILAGEEKNLVLDFGGSNDLITKIEKGAIQNGLIVYRGRGTAKDLYETEKPNSVLAVTNKQINRFILDEKVFYKKKAAFINDLEPKLLMKKICYSLEAAIDEKGEVNPINTVYVLKPKDRAMSLKFVLGILCSQLLTYYARTKYGTTHMRGGYIELRVFEVEKLPIPALDLSIKSDKDKHDRLVALVEQMLALKQKEHGETLPQTKTVIGRQIQALDRQIDGVVYGLYNLTEDTIKVIEEHGR